MTKRMILCVVALTLILVIACNGCNKIPVESTTTPVKTSPFTNTLPTTNTEAPDDIVPFQFGIIYRANIPASGNDTSSSTKWPPIETVTTNLSRGSDVISVEYRDKIITKSGQTRNNIINIMKLTSDNETWSFKSLNVSPVGAPSFLKFEQTGEWPHLLTVATVLVISVPPDTKSGQYDFSISVVLDGKDYGTLPCTIEVTN